MSAARDEVLDRIRAALRPPGAPAPTTALPGVYTGAPDAPADLQAAFLAMLDRVAATVDVVPDPVRARAALARVLEGAGRVALSDEPLVRDLTSGLEGISWTGDRSDREALLACDAGVTAAQHGIAETGTLVLCSAAEAHRLVSLLPPLHVAILSASRILWSLDDALAAVGAEDPTALSRAITLVTGPSRTADIELSLVIGVHGPQRLHVILLP